MGIALLQVSCASWAAGSIFARRRPVPVKPLMCAAVQMVAGGLATTLAGTLLGEWRGMHWTAQGAAAFLWLMAFGSIVGYGCHIYPLQKLPVGVVSLYTYGHRRAAGLAGDARAARLARGRGDHGDLGAWRW